MRRIRRKRPSLRLIVSSATLDATEFLNFFIEDDGTDDAAIVSLEGRMYPVEIAHVQEPVPDYVHKAAETVWNIHLNVRSCMLVGESHMLIIFVARARGCPGISHWPRRNRAVLGTAVGVAPDVRLLIFAYVGTSSH